MLEVRRDLDLAQEPLGTDAAVSSGRRTFTATQPAVLEVFGEEDRRHATAAELALDAVSISHPGLETIGGEGHG